MKLRSLVLARGSLLACLKGTSLRRAPRSTPPPAMKLDQILRDAISWAVIGLLVAIVALLHAQTLMQIVGFTRLGLDATELSAAPPPRSITGLPRVSPQRADPQRRLHSLAQPLRLGDRPFEQGHRSGGGRGRSGLVGSPLHAPHCEGLKVLVTAESADPEWSSSPRSPPARVPRPRAFFAEKGAR